MHAYYGADVKVTGNVTAEATGGYGNANGVYAYGAEVTVTSGVIATAVGGSCYGVNAEDDAEVEVTGDITATADGEYCSAYGVVANKATVTVGGIEATAEGENSESSGVVANNATVTVNGSIAVDATGYYCDATGVDSQNDAKAMVTGNVAAEATGDSGQAYGVSAYDAEAEVTGSVTATSNDYYAYGVYAQYGSDITVGSGVTATGSGSDKTSGVYADGIGAKVTVDGSVTVTGKGMFGDYHGVYANDGAEVEVTGNVTATAMGTYGTYYGAYAKDDAKVEVTGSVTVTGSGGTSYGVYAEDSEVTIDGTITATGSSTYYISFYINIDTVAKTGYKTTSAKDFYLEYTNNTSYVWVRDPDAAAIDPASKTFTAATAGYSAQTAQEFTIANNNKGSASITGLAASLGGSNFEISADLSDNEIDAGDSDTVSVRPKTGLSAGTYTDTLTISNNEGFSLTASLSFTVSSGGGSTGGGTTTPDTPTSTVIVDGKPVDAGEVKTDGDSTTVTVNQETLNKQLESATDNVTINVPAGTGTAEAQLIVQNIDDMAAKDMSLTIQVGNVQYEIPTTAVDTQAILDALGASSAADVQINITITTDMSAEAQAAVEAALAGGAELVFPPMEFSITATYNGQTVEIDEFSQYVTRAVEITAEQAARITTAIVVDPDGTTRQVPTNVYEKDGKWYAEVSSLTNSIYAFVSNAKSFTDAMGKWYEAAVNEMGSRMIINGVGGDLFDGDNDITRAEFAAIIVRALGLPENGSGAVFSDVSASVWYAGAVGKAYEYGIVNGVGGGRFDPTRQISRQEAMAMVQRAAGVAEFKGSAGSLSAFTDAGQVSDWARGAAEWNVGSGLIQGSDGKLRPLDNISRAETAAVVLRLLQKAGLVDVRSTR